MKPRRVILTLEVESDLPLSALRNVKGLEVYNERAGLDGWHMLRERSRKCEHGSILQVAVNSVQPAGSKR